MSGIDEQLCEDVLRMAADDHIYARAVSSRAIELGGQAGIEAIREHCLQVIRRLVLGGLMVVGEVDEQGRFTPRTGSPEDWVKSVETEWRGIGARWPTPGEVCWLSRTVAGVGAAASIVGT